MDDGLSGSELNFITAYAGSLRTFMLTRAAGRHVSGAQEAYSRIDVPGSVSNTPAARQEKHPGVSLCPSLAGGGEALWGALGKWPCPSGTCSPWL